ncbi:hypothetical protein M011DRAFT_472529 [Sporormia fimetaria CBS 119925]|uniref:Altered inheritance of mitochondria protein 6 n=1 Tax=Sporormia fimetaria CBS 119925 TaxID=1340428 RepID=A0A6A6UX10_9PLEO|nr:hypothetical protein M011DRAFT_472529 [Sporormia fimetaria CBS 119925]
MLNIFSHSLAILSHLNTTIHSLNPPSPNPPLTLPLTTPPLPIHSHNDYLHPHPLSSALLTGCTSLEADIWSFPSTPELYIGHDARSLSHTHTLRSVYLDPLTTLLSNAQQQNGTLAVWQQNPTQSLVLLIDYKTNGRLIHPLVLQQLEPLKEKRWLTIYAPDTGVVRGPLTIVVTGDVPIDLVVSNLSERYIFLDAPLNRLEDFESEEEADKTRFNTTNSVYASANFRKTIGWPDWRGELSETQLALLRKQIAAAESRGLRARFWGVPNRPVWLRDRVWEVLVREGVHVLSGDDLGGMVRAIRGSAETGMVDEKEKKEKEEL